MSKTEEELSPTQCKYIATYVQRLHKELQDVSDNDDLEAIAEAIPKLGLWYIDSKVPRWKFMKRVIDVAYNRKDLICDHKDSRHPQTMTGICQCEYHNDGELIDPEVKEKEQKLYLVLEPDEDTQKMDDTTPQYWCRNCCDQCEPGDVSCDMEDEF